MVSKNSLLWISENLKLKSIEVTLLIPYTESEKAAKLHTIGTVLEQEYKENGTFYEGTSGIRTVRGISKNL